MPDWHIGQAEAVHQVDTQPQVLAQLDVEGLSAGVLLGKGREQRALQTHLRGGGGRGGGGGAKGWLSEDGGTVS